MLDHKPTLEDVASTPVNYNSKHQTSGDVKASAGASSQQTSDQEAANDNAAASSSDESASAPVAPSSRRGRKQSLTEDPSKTFVCTLCSRRFRRQEHLKRHYRSLHTHDKPFECTDCGKKFLVFYCYECSPTSRRPEDDGAKRLWQSDNWSARRCV